MSRTIDSIGSLPLPPPTTGHHPIGKPKLLVDYPVASPSLNLIAFAFRFDRLVAGLASTEAPLAFFTCSLASNQPPSEPHVPTGISLLTSALVAKRQEFVRQLAPAADILSHEPECARG